MQRNFNIIKDKHGELLKEEKLLIIVELDRGEKQRLDISQSIKVSRNTLKKYIDHISTTI